MFGRTLPNQSLVMSALPANCRRTTSPAAVATYARPGTSHEGA